MGEDMQSRGDFGGSYIAVDVDVLSPYFNVPARDD